MIEQKMGLEEAEPAQGLGSTHTLDSIPMHDAFARESLSRARKPRFKFIAPGFRVPTDDDFVNQLFDGFVADPGDDDELPQVLLFRGDVDARVATGGCPCGVYIPPTARSYSYP
jgi:hypothetical protein